ncbi:MAG: hypothetical protein OQK52_06530 [Ignavibacteriaceae bacterium]|nr:hypothetical protein [Ignavibacteriaceae bacterium]
MLDKKTIDWLMKGDSSIRWQVMKDLPGKATRWNTLRALRVLKKYNVSIRRPLSLQFEMCFSIFDLQILSRGVTG